MIRIPVIAKSLLLAPIALLLLAACNLTNVPPTATPQPTPVPLLLPTIPPVIAPGTVLTPVGGSTTGTVSTCPLTPPTWIPYTVQAGDSLGAISVAVDTPLQDLVTNNCLQDANSLFADQVIYLPRLP
jgi:hypothetical protein